MTLYDTARELQATPQADRIAELAASGALVFNAPATGGIRSEAQAFDEAMATGWQIAPLADFPRWARLTALLLSLDNDGLFGDELTAALEAAMVAAEMKVAA